MNSVAFRFIAANDHPDHDTIATFRRRFLAEIEALFLQSAPAGAGDGRSENGDGGAGRYEDPRQCQPAQRVVGRHAGKIEPQLKAEVADSHGQSRSGGRGGHSRRHVDTGRTGAARGAFAQAGRGAGEDRGAEPRNAMRASRRSTKPKLAARQAKAEASGKKPRGKPPNRQSR